MDIKLPHNFEPRPYQLPFLQAMDEGILRAVLLWHRRSGKDKTLINYVIKKAFERVGAYYYFFPTYRQGKKILWDGMDKDGFKFIDHIPKGLIKNKNETELKVEFVNGSIFQIIGTDNYNNIVGTNPVGCVFSEYALQDPIAWDYVRPILAENGGWAIFNFTARGENHGFDIYNYAKDNPKWFCQLLTVDDTHAISQEVLDQERQEIIAKNGDDAIFYQEYYCSFNVAIQGSYYGQLLREAEAQGRIGQVPYEKGLSVDTYWDLGMNDKNAIWFVQSMGQEIRLIDYYENNGEGLAHYAKVLQDRGYVYGRHHFPHDIAVREMGTGKSRLETANTLGLKPNTVVPKMDVSDGIEAVRNILSRCWFDKEKCKRGLDALKSYHKHYDEINKTFRNYPCHDWSSNGADGFRYLAVGFKEFKHITTPSTFGGVKPFYPQIGL